MTNQSRRFEIVVLRPLLFGFTILALISLFQGKWWWLGGCVIASLWVSVVGQSLHPLQSVSDLFKGPTDTPAALREAELLPPEIVMRLVDRACKSISILLGLTAGFVVWEVVGWSWYYALPIAWVALCLTFCFMKIAFTTL